MSEAPADEIALDVQHWQVLRVERVGPVAYRLWLDGREVLGARRIELTLEAGDLAGLVVYSAGAP